MILKNDCLIRALLREPVIHTPIWIMRQAGRYLPEYRATRAKAGNFLTLCKTPELACEVTLQPLQRFNLDAAIIFSDILTIPDAMGLGLYFTEGEGPRFHHPLRDEYAIKSLRVPDVATELCYVSDAIKLVKKELAGKVPLIGFSGSPWTLATYMVEGGASKDFSVIKKMLFTEPVLLQALLKTLTATVVNYLNAQIVAGADAIMLFDTWGGVLSTRDYQLFSLYYMTEIIKQLTCEHAGKRIPVIVFTKGGAQWLELIAASGCDAVGIDWTINIDVARVRIGDRVALQGNMDPTVLYATPERIKQEAQEILAAYGKGPGHVFNLGHGIGQHVPIEHVQALIETVHGYSGQKS
jgi:uroporphyrinogen decarboxylase